MTQKRVKKRGRRKSTKRHYFTQVHEDAIVRYARIDDIKERTVLYVDFIQPAFNEMVDKIIFTYKFTNLPNIAELRDECKIWLTMILDKYDPNKGSKAKEFLEQLEEAVSEAEDTYNLKHLGLVAAKYLETLQRSNEQLVKVAALLQKKQGKSEGFTEKDKDELFDMIKEVA